DSNIYSDRNRNGYVYSNTCGYCNIHADANSAASIANPDRDSNIYPDCDSNVYSDSNSNSNSAASIANPDCDSNIYSDANSNSNLDSNTNSNSATDANPDSNAKTSCALCRHGNVRCYGYSLHH